MKLKNFPARKLARQIRANGDFLIEHKQELDNARTIRTKKQRGAVK